MRTKTLLLTAALGVVGAATTMAQVYSVNAVGYVNVTLKAGRFNLVANPLDAGSGNNTVSKLLSAAPDGTLVYTYTAAGGYSSVSYTTLFGWDDPNVVLDPGKGFWVLTPAGTDVTVTFVGDVLQGHLTTALDKGFTLVGSKVPQAGKLQTDLKYTPADGDIVYTFTPSGGYASFSYTDLFGWDSEPAIGVGEGFWILKAAAGTWTRDFSVN